MSKELVERFRSAIDAGLVSFCSDEPDFTMSAKMRRIAAEHILAQPLALSRLPDREEVARQTITDALMDSQYLAGVTAGWNAAQSDDPNAALAQLQASRAGHLKGYKDAKRIISLMERKA